MPRGAARLEIIRAERTEGGRPIERTPFVIGSDPAADLRIEAPGVAPRHARIVVLGGAYRLVPGEDAGPLSLDGTAAPQDGLPLRHGARIALGDAGGPTLLFLLDPAVPKDRADRLSTLLEIARTISSSLLVDEVLERVLEGAVRFSGAERGYLFLKDGARLVPWSRGADPRDVEVSRSVAEEVARTGTPVYRDMTTGLDGRRITDSIVRLRLQAILCLPLAVRQDIIGVVYLDSRRPLPQHDPDLSWLEALAGLAAIAIQNSRLVEERLRAERTIAMGQMARGIVHDLRSPLSSIRGLADLLLERAPEGDPMRPHLATIIAEVDRLTRLTDDLLQFSRDARPPQISDVKPADLVRSILKPLGPRLARSGVRVELALDENVRTALDAQRMIRALHNLVANALQAMPKGGTLTLACAQEGGRCLLTVHDTGCGMSEEVRKRVFEPFFTHGGHGGAGLGMAIVRTIVEEHRGDIQIESAPGAGTTVLLSIPAGR